MVVPRDPVFLHDPSILVTMTNGTSNGCINTNSTSMTVLPGVENTIKSGPTMKDDVETSVQDIELPQASPVSDNNNNDDDDDDDDEAECCPLFMEGLPTDFASNPHLAAIASLLDDDEPPRKPQQATAIPVLGKVGGGKMIRSSSRQQRRQNQAAPYQASKRKPSASMGETQLFLKMWKL
jgi:hypothetical protein